MKNVLVTGGAGFIGSNFVRYMLENYDYNIINLDCLTYAGNLENLKDIENDERYTFVKGDIRDEKIVAEVFEKYDIDTVVNFAAESHVDRSIEDPQIFLTTNVLGTQVLLDASKRFWKINPDDKYCRKFKDGVKYLQVATDEVYGTLGKTGFFTETTPLAPNSPYSSSKASADLMVRAYHETFGLPVNITRCSNNYGPYQFPEKLIPLMINNCLKERDLPVYGDGLQVRDWLHVKDHCSGISTVLHKGRNGEIYNIGGNNEKANIEIVKLIIKDLGKSNKLIKYVKDRPGHDRRYAIDNNKITTELGWSPSYTFEKGIKETIEWYKNNTEWSKRVLFGDKVSKIKVKDNNLIFKFKGCKYIGKTFLIVVDRTSGHRAKYEIIKGKVKVSIDELSKLCTEKILELKIRLEFQGDVYTKRIGWKDAYKLNVKSEEGVQLKTYKTKNNNCGIKMIYKEYEHEASEIKSIGTNFFFKGRLKSCKEKIDVIELVFKRRDKNKAVGFKMNIDNSNNNIYDFSGYIYCDKFNPFLVMNSRWDCFIQARNHNKEVVYKSLVNLSGYKDFHNEEDRYLANANNGDFTTSIYATMGKNSMAFWHTSKKQFEKTYNIAKGKTIYNEVCESTPLNEKMIVFESFLGKNYSGSPKYIYEYMLNNPKFKDFTFVWSYEKEDIDDIPGNAIIVNRTSPEFYKYMAEAKYWCGNIVFPIHKKREGNVYIQTWHGTPLKRLGFDIEIEGPETLARENFYLESRNWDYLISANEYSSNIFKRAFKFDKEVIESGYPLNDIFYRNDFKEKVDEIKSKLNIPKNKKVILYAPTWRDDEMVDSWENNFNIKFDLDNFKKKFGNDYILILRMHHLVSEGIELDENLKDYIYDLSKYNDVQELYAIADMLITDYSSVFFDYANTRRPILFFAYDIEKYRDKLRGFYLDMEKDLPGPIVTDEYELFDAIENVDKVSDDYKEKYEHFYNKYCYLEDGNASKRVIETVFKDN